MNHLSFIFQHASACFLFYTAMVFICRNERLSLLDWPLLRLWRRKTSYNSPAQVERVNVHFMPRQFVRVRKWVWKWGVAFGLTWCDTARCEAAVYTEHVTRVHAEEQQLHRSCTCLRISQTSGGLKGDVCWTDCRGWRRPCPSDFHVELEKCLGISWPSL